MNQACHLWAPDRPGTLSTRQSESRRHSHSQVTRSVIIHMVQYYISSKSLMNTRLIGLMGRMFRVNAVYIFVEKIHGRVRHSHVQDALSSLLERMVAQGVPTTNAIINAFKKIWTIGRPSKRPLHYTGKITMRGRWHATKLRTCVARCWPS